MRPDQGPGVPTPEAGEPLHGVARSQSPSGIIRLDQEVREDAEATTPRLWGRGTFISLIITVIVLSLMVWGIHDPDKVWAALLQASPWMVAVACLAHYATYLVRGVRWRRTLRHLQSEHGSLKFGLLVFFYNFVDNVVPGKLGDVYGAHLARINFGIRRSSALGSIVFLRMIDAWFLLVLAAIASLIMFAEDLPTWVVWSLIGGGILAAAMTLPLIVFGAMKKAPPKRLPQAIQTRIKSFQAGMWPRSRELAAIAGLTTLVWVLESLWMWLLVLAFGYELTLVQVLFVTTISLIASAVPITPSGAGFVEASLFFCLQAVGLPGEAAAAVTVMNRLLDVYLHIFLGLVAFWFRHHFGLRTWREVPLEQLETGEGSGPTS